MGEHPIERLMITAMNSIKDMIDVNTIIGKPIETINNTVIIPVSKVSFGFAAGGSEFKGETIDEYKRKDEEEAIQYRLPFGGGSGAGVSINPVGFIFVGGDSSQCPRFIPVEHSCAIDKILDYMPDLFEKANQAINKVMEMKCQRDNNEEADKTTHKKVNPKTTTYKFKYNEKKPETFAEENTEKFDD